MGPKDALEECLQVRSKGHITAHPVEINLGHLTLTMVQHMLLGAEKGVAMDHIREGI